MYGYIPQGMLQKQYRWEWVNYYLYQRLNRINPYPNLQNVITELFQKQEKQLSLLWQFAAMQEIRTPQSTIHVQFRAFSETIKELYDREYQLLQEYMSYSEYFLSAHSKMQSDLKDLVESQIWQVNTLIQLKQTVSDLQGGEGTGYRTPQQKPDYILEKGYQLRRVVTGLTYPTHMTFDNQGTIYIVEAGYAYGTAPGKGRVLRLEADGALTEVAGGFGGPVTGTVWHKGYFYVAYGAIGEEHGPGCGEISRFSPDGKKEVIVSGLQTCGDHFTGDVAFGPDGRLYFSVGTASNSAVVGTDNVPWLKMHPRYHDTPARNVVLNGTNFITSNPLTEQRDVALTGAYKPFGVPSYDGERIQGKMLANGVIYSCDPDGSNLQIVADGLRNPFGLKFSPYNGKMYITDNGADPRGSRQIHQDWDNFWEITPQGWYGFPDFYSGLPVTLPHFHVEEQAKPTFLLKQHPQLAGQPLIRFESHSASHKFDFCTNASFGHAGQIFVAQLGGLGFEEYEELPGFKVVRANIETGQVFDFLVNLKGEANKEGPIRPVAVTFSPDGKALYVVDFGILGSMGAGTKPQPKTGSLWRIDRV